MEAIVIRIGRALGDPDLVEALARKVVPSDLQSLLMGVFRRRAACLTAPDLLAQYQRSAAVRPSLLDPRVMNELERVLFRVAHAFDPIELSPVQPLGSVSVLGGIDQNNVMTAIRNVEVIADPTNGCALEAAARRRDLARRGAAHAVRLCGSHRVVRLQPFDAPGFTPHFRLFTLATAGRDTGSLRFELEGLVEHVATHLELLSSLPPEYQVTALEVELADTEMINLLAAARGLDAATIRAAVGTATPGGSERLLAARGITLPTRISAPSELRPLDGSERWRRLVDRLERMDAGVAAPLRARFPTARITFDLSRLEGLGYYAPWAFRITGENAGGLRMPLADGGLTDWTQKLLSDRKERMFISGVGAELLCKLFRQPPGAIADEMR